MQIPLHLNKRNLSMVKRVHMQLDLYFHMSQANPNGFRQAPTSRKGSKSRAKQLNKGPVTRAETLAQFLKDK